MNKFRPQNISKLFIMRERRVYGGRDSYNWQTRIEWYPVGYNVNKKTIARQFRKLHYLACHAPKPVAVKWRSAYNQFERKHFTKTASMRYANTYSCDAWL